MVRASPEFTPCSIVKRAMRKRDVMWAKLTNEKRKKATRTCRCMISIDINSMSAVDGACVGDGLVGEGGTAMRSSVTKMDGQGAHK